MPLVQIGDISRRANTTGTLTIPHTVASGESLIVVVIMATASNSVTGINWDEGGVDQAPLSGRVVFNPSHGNLRQEVWSIAAPVNKTADVQVTLGIAQRATAICISANNMNKLSKFATDEGRFKRRRKEARSGGPALNRMISRLVLRQPSRKVSFLISAFKGATGNYTFVEGGDTIHQNYEVGTAWDVVVASQDSTGPHTYRWRHGGIRRYSSIGFIIEST